MRPVLLTLPPDTVLDALFVQACITRPDGEPYIDGLRRYTALLLVELQGQVFDAAHTRAYDAERRERKRAAGNPQPLSAQDALG